MPLKITVRSVLPAREPGDLAVVGVTKSSGSKKKDKRTPLDGFERATGGALGRLLKKEEFKGKDDDPQIGIATLGRAKPDHLVVIGLGERSKVSPAVARTFAAKAARAANSKKAKRLVLGVPAELEGYLRELVEGLELGAYRFNKYLTGSRRPKTDLGQVTVCLMGSVPADAKEIVDRAQAIAAGVNVARDLSNEPGNVIFPETLADAAKQVAKETGLKIQHFDFKEVQRRGMKLIQAVGQGSEHKPCLVHLSWTPPRPKKRLVFVGKGVTFDSGGLSIKPAANMGEMKQDMSGAANVVGFMSIIGRLKPDVEVHGIFASAENMPDGGAYRPGDIWPSLDGKSVEIINTDAEGRLILADALAYARALEPDIMVDNATLTGACVVALGGGCSAWYASNEEVAETFAAAVKGTGEQMWRMPLLEELKDHLKSDTPADLKHTGDRWGGSITAALFLREFIGDVENWVHCDIAGPAIGDRTRGWDPKGGTGHGVLTFFELVERASKSAPEVEAETARPAGTTDGTKASRASGSPARPKRAASVLPATKARSARVRR